MSAPTREPDCALFALIGEYRRRDAWANQFDVDDAERARRCDNADEVREQIDKFRPATLRGVLAVLDFSSEIERGDPDYWPDEAIEGIRAIVNQESHQ